MRRLPTDRALGITLGLVALLAAPVGAGAAQAHHSRTIAPLVRSTLLVIPNGHQLRARPPAASARRHGMAPRARHDVARPRTSHLSIVHRCWVATAHPLIYRRDPDSGRGASKALEQQRNLGNTATPRSIYGAVSTRGPQHPLYVTGFHEAHAPPGSLVAS